MYDFKKISLVLPDFGPGIVHATEILCWQNNMKTAAVSIVTLVLFSYLYGHSWGARLEEQPAPFTLHKQLHWHTFPANGATCRPVRGSVRTVSEGNEDRPGGDVVGGAWASVTGTIIRALSFPPVLLSATGTHTEPGTGTGQGTDTCQKCLLCDLSEQVLSYCSPDIWTAVWKLERRHKRERDHKEIPEG